MMAGILAVSIVPRSLSLAALVIAIITMAKLFRVSKRIATTKALEAAVADLRDVIDAGNKEVGERVNGNQTLLRKRIDALDDDLKRHSARIDLLKSQVTGSVGDGVQAISNQIAALAADVVGLDEADEDPPLSAS